MIVLIDDEYRRMAANCEYLRYIGYDVVLLNNVDSAIAYIQHNADKIEAIIMDIMMHWGEMFTKEDTNSGLFTGYLLYHKIRGMIGFGVPIIIYTALDRADILKELTEEVNCYVFRKSSISIVCIGDLLGQVIRNND